jgi:hypothetical protein
MNLGVLRKRKNARNGAGLNPDCTTARLDEFEWRGPSSLRLRVLQLVDRARG